MVCGSAMRFDCNNSKLWRKANRNVCKKIPGASTIFAKLGIWRLRNVDLKIVRVEKT